MSEFQSIGVIARRADPRITPTISSLCEVLAGFGRKVLVDDAAEAPGDLHGARCASRADIAAECDLGVVIGGDGTLLSAARDLAPAGIPILGVNQGRLGFMVDVPPEDMAEVLRAVFDGQYTIEDRLLLEAQLNGDGASGGPMLAVNDVVVRNLAAIRMLEFETWLDGEFISQHRADGLIVSTPTGSTAYALSGGGPVLHPSLDAVALVPICPHTLSDRPIVVGADQTVRVVLRGEEGTEATCTCDGQASAPLRSGDTLEVRRAKPQLRLIHPNGYSYFNILRSKLQWGRGPAQGSSVNS